MDAVWRSAEAVNDAMLRVYNYMATGLGITAIAAFFVATNPAVLQFLFGSMLAWPVILAPLAFVLIMSFGYARFSANTLRLLFFTYSAINGLSFGLIASYYTVGSIFIAFGCASAIFIVMSAYGYLTKRSLEGIGPFMLVGLIGLIIAMIANMFIGSAIMTTIISCVAVVIFTVLVAYDTQRIRDDMMSPSLDTDKIAVMGALSLYLDFINLMIHLLQLLGVKKD